MQDYIKFKEQQRQTFVKSSSKPIKKLTEEDFGQPHQKTKVNMNDHREKTNSLLVNRFKRNKRASVDNTQIDQNRMSNQSKMNSILKMNMTSVIQDDSEQELHETERQRLLSGNLSVNITFDQPDSKSVKVRKYDEEGKISSYFLNEGEEKPVEGEYKSYMSREKRRQNRKEQYKEGEMPRSHKDKSFSRNSFSRSRSRAKEFGEQANGTGLFSTNLQATLPQSRKNGQRNPQSEWMNQSQMNSVVSQPYQMEKREIGHKKQISQNFSKGNTQLVQDKFYRSNQSQIQDSRHEKEFKFADHVMNSNYMNSLIHSPTNQNHNSFRPMSVIPDNVSSNTAIEHSIMQKSKMIKADYSKASFGSASHFMQAQSESKMTTNGVKIKPKEKIVPIKPIQPTTQVQSKIEMMENQIKKFQQNFDSKAGSNHLMKSKNNCQSKANANKKTEKMMNNLVYELRSAAKDRTPIIKKYNHKTTNGGILLTEEDEPNQSHQKEVLERVYQISSMERNHRNNSSQNFTSNKRSDKENLNQSITHSLNQSYYSTNTQSQKKEPQQKYRVLARSSVNQMFQGDSSQFNLTPYLDSSMKRSNLNETFSTENSKMEERSTTLGLRASSSIKHSKRLENQLSAIRNQKVDLEKMEKSYNTEYKHRIRKQQMENIKTHYTDSSQKPTISIKEFNLNLVN